MPKTAQTQIHQWHTQNNSTKTDASIKSIPAKQTFAAKTKNKTEDSKRYNKNIKNTKTLEEILQEINNHLLPSKNPYHTSPFLRHKLVPGMNWWSCEADCAAPFAQTISSWRLKALASLLVRWVGKQEVARNLDVFFTNMSMISVYICLIYPDVPIHCLKPYLDRLTTPEADEHVRCRYCLYVSWPGSLLLALCSRRRSG